MKTHYDIIEVSPGLLRPSPQEPEDRLKTSAALNRLQASLKSIGLMYPPLVIRHPTDKEAYIVVDGHRRWQAAVALGWPSISVMVATGTPGHLFQQIAGNTKGLSSANWLEVYLKGGLLPERTQVTTFIKKLELLCGHDYLERLHAAGLRPSVWNLSRQVMVYADIPDSERKNVLEWLLELRLTKTVRAWVEGDNPAHMLKEAFEKRVNPDDIRQQQLFSTIEPAAA
jgi:hypothetical protein